MGDRKAVKMAYPHAKEQILDNYVQDSICGTWEVLADAVYPEGSQKLEQMGYPHIGKAKSEWAKNIAPHLDVENNQSGSFQAFRDGIKKLAGAASSKTRKKTAILHKSEYTQKRGYLL